MYSADPSFYRYGRHRHFGLSGNVEIGGATYHDYTPALPSDLREGDAARDTAGGLWSIDSIRTSGASSGAPVWRVRLRPLAGGPRRDLDIRAVSELFREFPAVYRLGAEVSAPVSASSSVPSSPPPPTVPDASPVSTPTPYPARRGGQHLPSRSENRPAHGGRQVERRAPRFRMVDITVRARASGRPLPARLEWWRGTAETRVPEGQTVVPGRGNVRLPAEVLTLRAVAAGGGYRSATRTVDFAAPAPSPAVVLSGFPGLLGLGERGEELAAFVIFDLEEEAAALPAGIPTAEFTGETTEHTSTVDFDFLPPTTFEVTGTTTPPVTAPTPLTLTPTLTADAEGVLPRPPVLGDIIYDLRNGATRRVITVEGMIQIPEADRIARWVTFEGGQANAYYTVRSLVFGGPQPPTLLPSGQAPPPTYTPPSTPTTSLPPLPGYVPSDPLQQLITGGYDPEVVGAFDAGAFGSMQAPPPPGGSPFEPLPPAPEPPAPAEAGLVYAGMGGGIPLTLIFGAGLLWWLSRKRKGRRR